jgi:hypothetical protein
MSTRFPVPRGWSVQRLKVGMGIAMLSRTSTRSIQVMSSVLPLAIAALCGCKPSTVVSRFVVTAASLG